MPIWGEERITWRQILPPALIALAILAAAYSIHSCVRGEDTQVSRAQQFRLYKTQLANSDPVMVAAAARGLAELGDSAATDLLRPKLRDNDPRVQASAETLLQCLESSNAAVVAGGAAGLGALREKKAAEPLTRLLASPDVDVRTAAIVALGQIGDPAAAKAIEALQSNPTAGVNPQPIEQDRIRIEEAIREALAKLGAAKPPPR
jgi:HEAT repeat protein